MSDREIRLLERRVAEGDEDAEVPLLRERVRAGLVSQFRLDLAARLGSSVAVAAGGIGPPLDWGEPSDRREALTPLPSLRVIALGVGWFRECLPAWGRIYPNDRLLPGIAETVDGWLRARSASAVIHANDLANRADRDHYPEERYDNQDAEAFVSAAGYCARSLMLDQGHGSVVNNVSGVAIAVSWTESGSVEAWRRHRDESFSRQKAQCAQALLMPEEPT